MTVAGLETSAHNFETLYHAPSAAQPPQQNTGAPVTAGDDPRSASGAAARADGTGASEPLPIPIVSLRHVARSFGAVRAVIDGTIDLFAGEAHALLGENGAGKSTLVKILAGVHEPDDGEVLLDGRRVSLPSPAAARDAGIAVIYQ